MKLRDLIASVHMPYRKVVYWVATVASFVICLPSWLPPRYFFIRYVFIFIALVSLLYCAFWVYRGGYRKQGLLMAIGYITFFSICIALLIYVQQARGVV